MIINITIDTDKLVPEGHANIDPLYHSQGVVDEAMAFLHKTYPWPKYPHFLRPSRVTAPLKIEDREVGTLTVS